MINNRHSLKRILTPNLAVAALVGLGAILSAQTLTVTGQGMAMTRDAALSAAKRDAVEKGVGVVVASETLVKNFQVVEDRILSKAKGGQPARALMACGQ